MDELVVKPDRAHRDYIVSEAAKIAVLLIPRLREGRDVENTLIGELVRVGAPYDLRRQLVKEFQATVPDLLTPDVEDLLLAPVCVRAMSAEQNGR